MADHQDELEAMHKELQAWKLVAQRVSGKSVEELQEQVDAIFSDEPESLNG